MKIVQQRIFVLGSAGAELDPKDNLLLCIDGIKTDKSFKEFCESYKQNDDSIKAHTIIGEYPIVENRIKLKNGIDISIWNEDKNEEVFFVKKGFPLIQMPDKETIKEEDFLEKIYLIKKELSEIDLKANFVDEFKNEEEDNIEIIENIIEEDFLMCEDYEKDRDNFISEGFEEFVLGKYILLLRTNENAKAILLELNNENYTDLKFSVLEKDLSKKYLKIKSENGTIFVLSENKLQKLD
jgi:hypothetical protein